MMESRDKNSSFDPLLFLRGLSAVAILLYHMQYPGVRIPPIAGFDIHWITNSNGFSMIWIFFILSGYLISKGFFTKRYSFTKKGLLQYYLSRFLKIAPPYYLIILYLWLGNLIYPKDDLPSLLFKLFSFNAADQIIRNGIDYLWTISIEMQWYLVAPLVCIIFIVTNRINKYVSILFALTIIIIEYFFRSSLFNNNFPHVYGKYLLNIHAPPWLNVDFFIFGILMNVIIISFSEKICKNISRSNEIKLQSILRIISVLFFIAFFIFSSFQRQLFLYDYHKNIAFQGTIFPIITMLVTGFYIFASEWNAYYTSYRKPRTQENNLFSKISIRNILQLVGLTSLEFYLLHLPLLRLTNLNCWSFEKGCLPDVFIFRFLMIFFITSVSAWILHLILRPINSFLRKSIMQKIMAI